MSRSDPQVNFRMPAELKEKLEQAAAANHRSITAELVSRLQDSFFHENVGRHQNAGFIDVVLDAQGEPISWDEIREHIRGINREGNFEVFEQRVTVLTPELVSSKLRQEHADRIESYYQRSRRKRPGGKPPAES
ncbi:Arc family DNA-binding protein [Pseudomonas aeruginosa]|uniref:Arc family DNA-binding protein n=2 Tax=Pseudomonas aeruginosa TaxID=287 RepID=UPI0009AAADE9|nr:Arc family DNA-binding protein [Pseudomonas aeruginosa]MCV4086597.1 Arc family DNA-binding protein [Pseudomonas aeruginosa]MCV4124695.1 Arc family DNA-binding protein [Pseudomonas aeruginosa]QTQ95430.1 Arc family DNA-binding protein [Pseudomonas aeruginosa]HBO3290780.1 Arc family DNA-binding protein [Pseudomonas aeruginosa]HCF4607905.1 Arc family DNA-binding protein [Pseudomonas aeruginosa]